ncbi:Calcium/calmodulin-dependent/calcium-dependent protein kinase [Penicillium concentricum]|uniref:Calcium/calmodulin-dependent/calcium-dependent protein kinase n=1 Tax=Penicillium concentricum TaxID=293559 RepID=A0A9W9VBP2_9EURO|nr:Calcium/calmodulin-dependent/calcium-dependent protein kinase [Penicillium concentricum]KAJ5373645.1 Calcium/calmodulin-dependent/calcium-dependent protein kinase [Penicillium concentricum]
MNGNVVTPMSDISAEPSIDSLEGMNDVRPQASRVGSTASYDSTQRHRRRNPRARRPVKETLDARSEYYTSQDDGTAEHRINQYVIRQEIGRGSFGAVHLAADQFGNEYAVKEFSKSRLRKRAQSHLLRRPRGPSRPGSDFNSPLHRHPSGDDNETAKNPLYLIKEEIAIMKKLNHSNLVSLIEVLDDPSEDSLYMVMEMCKKGVVMKVGLEERADPYDDEQCRCWFRDLILGIEYLHSQGIVHRDIKPDNCLVTNDDMLKVVDFGVSEMFEKDSDMFTAKSAGSPAFLPPELCVVKHGDVSGKATDIWSMGVTLYCLRYGKLPFEKQSIFELYDSIRGDPLVYEDESDEGFKDMIGRILEKDPEKRIDMFGLREHPWVTKNGTDPLLSFEENTSQLIEPPTEEEMNSAITTNMGHLMTVMKAVKKFKRLTDPTKPQSPIQSMFGKSILGGDHDACFVEPPMEMDPDEPFPAVGAAPQTHDAHGSAGPRKVISRHPFAAFRDNSGNFGSSDSASFSSRPEHSPNSSKRPSGVFEPERKDSGSIRNGEFPAQSDIGNEAQSISQWASPHIPLSRASSGTKRSLEGTRGHARDPLEEEFPYLFIGPSTYNGSSQQEPDMEISDEPASIFQEPEHSMDPSDQMGDDEPVQFVSESPGAADFNIYETAYRKELDRIKHSLRDRDTGPKLYLTRLIEKNSAEVMKLAKEKELDLQIGNQVTLSSISRTPSGFGSVVSAMRSQMLQKRQAEGLEEQGGDASKDKDYSQNHNPHPHPPKRLSVSSQSIPEPEPSTLEATGVSSTEGSGDSKAQLQRILDRVRGKSGSSE